MKTQQLTTTFNGMIGIPLLTKKGVMNGVRMTFGTGQAANQTASDVRATLKAEGVKGRELTRLVNEVLTGDKDVRWAKHEAAISVLRSNGAVPDYVDARKGGATARFIYPKSPVAGVTKSDALEVLGLTADEFEGLRAMAAERAASAAKALGV